MVGGESPCGTQRLSEYDQRDGECAWYQRDQVGARDIGYLGRYQTGRYLPNHVDASIFEAEDRHDGDAVDECDQRRRDPVEPPFQEQQQDDRARADEQRQQVGLGQRSNEVEQLLPRVPID